MQSIRILAGLHKNRRLDYAPRQGLRPTCHRLKGSVFNILTHRFYPDRMALPTDQHFSSLTVMDLFAGVGSYGLEALSRGAQQAVFVEGSPLIVQDLKVFIQKLGYQAQASVWCKTLPNKLSLDIKADIIFLDPPYEFSALKVQEVLTWAHTLLSPSGVVVLEFPQSVTCDTLDIVFQRKTSRTTLSFLQHPQQEESIEEN